MQDHIRIPFPWRRVTRDIASGPHLFERFQYDGLYRFPALEMRFLPLSHALADEFHFGQRGIRQISIIEEIAQGILDHIHRDTEIACGNSRWFTCENSDLFDALRILTVQE